MKIQRSHWFASLLIGICAAAMTPAEAAEKPDNRFYEMRIYYAAPGKLDALHARFRDHTMKLFEKHGMVNLGYFVPVANPDNRLIYFLAYPSREAREQSWKAFMADPDWQKARRESEVQGRLVEKVESTFLRATDYSPEIKTSIADQPRLFELRTYKAAPGKLPDLHARFRDHTIRLFSKHGMENLAYWTPVDKDKGAEDTLIYLLAHKSREGAQDSWEKFGTDPDWVRARQASEEKAGGRLTVQGGVQSVLMMPTDYSRVR